MGGKKYHRQRRNGLVLGVWGAGRWNEYTKTRFTTGFMNIQIAGFFFILDIPAFELCSKHNGIFL